jgi:hypothetical protein
MKVIATTRDLNNFIESVDISDPDKIISRLADKKLIISPQMARFVLNCRDFHDTRICFQPTF